MGYSIDRADHHAQAAIAAILHAVTHGHHAPLPTAAFGHASAVPPSDHAPGGSAAAAAAAAGLLFGSNGGPGAVVGQGIVSGEAHAGASTPAAHLTADDDASEADGSESEAEAAAMGVSSDESAEMQAGPDSDIDSDELAPGHVVPASHPPSADWFVPSPPPPAALPDPPHMVLATPTRFSCIGLRIRDNEDLRGLVNGVIADMGRSRVVSVPLSFPPLSQRMHAGTHQTDEPCKALWLPPEGRFNVMSWSGGGVGPELWLMTRLQDGAETLTGMMPFFRGRHAMRTTVQCLVGAGSSCPLEGQCICWPAPGLAAAPPVRSIPSCRCTDGSVYWPEAPATSLPSAAPDARSTVRALQAGRRAVKGTRAAGGSSFGAGTAEPAARGGAAALPLIFEVIDFAMCAEAVSLPTQASVHLAAFAREIQVCRLADASQGSAAYESEWAALGCGLDDPPIAVPWGVCPVCRGAGGNLVLLSNGVTAAVQPMAVLTGRVLSSRLMVNKLSLAQFRWILADTALGPVDMLVDRAMAGAQSLNTIGPGDLVRGYFWMVGQLSEYKCRNADFSTSPGPQMPVACIPRLYGTYSGDSEGDDMQ